MKSNVLKLAFILITCILSCSPPENLVRVKSPVHGRIYIYTDKNIIHFADYNTPDINYSREEFSGRTMNVFNSNGEHVLTCSHGEDGPDFWWKLNHSRF
jgi:hypothetical protein